MTWKGGGLECEKISCIWDGWSLNLVRGVGGEHHHQQGI